MMRSARRIPLLLLALLWLCAACDSGSPTATAVPPTATATPAPVAAAPTDTTAPAAAPTDTTAPAAPTNTTAPAAPTDTTAPAATATSATTVSGGADATIIAALKAAGLPIGDVVIFTAETDPNKLLGRPNQYIAKATWQDTRIATPTAGGALEVSNGGGLEIYPDNAGAQARSDYIQNIGKKLPAFAEYDFVRGPVLLRLGKDLTPAQADEYKKAFDLVPLP